MDVDCVNVGRRLTKTAGRDPEGIAVVEQLSGRGGSHRYRTITFRELDAESNRIAAGLHQYGVKPGMRMVLLVPPGINFVTLVFALFKSGAVTILIDPGMGREHLIECLSEAGPDGFMGVPRAHVARLLYRKHFPTAKHNVTVGRRWCWRGLTLKTLRRCTVPVPTPATDPSDPAAIIFTTGSTGPPKGVLYRHGNFDRQVTEIQERYQIEPGEVDVACFPLFALFNAGMGVSTVFPAMDYTRPADVNPQHVVAAIQDWQASQTFGSPALWNAVGKYCEATHQTFPSLRRILSAGAPVPTHVLRRMTATIEGNHGEMHTPYGATEALPIASISAKEVLGETAALSEEGAGTCVGARFPGIRWKVIQITDEPLAGLNDVVEMASGEIGELIVSGPVVTTEYVTRTEANALSKIADGETFWHRMGDVGYRDEGDRFWYCGRKSQRVTHDGETLFTIPCEAIVNRDNRVYRSALVAVEEAGRGVPVMVVELHPKDRPATPQEASILRAELLDLAKSHPRTRRIERILLHPKLPVDIRHNSKIFRERLAVWATQRICDRRDPPAT